MALYTLTFPVISSFECIYTNPFSSTNLFYIKPGPWGEFCNSLKLVWRLIRGGMRIPNLGEVILKLRSIEKLENEFLWKNQRQIKFDVVEQGYSNQKVENPPIQYFCVMQLRSSVLLQAAPDRGLGEKSILLIAPYVEAGYH